MKWKSLISETDTSAEKTRDLECARGEVADGKTPAEAIAGSARGGYGAQQLVTMFADLSADISGLGTTLSGILSDKTITDILINGPTELWIDRGNGLVRLPVSLGTDSQLRILAVRMAAACGKRLDDAAPVVDGTMPDGTRLHAIVPPLAVPTTVISLRTQRRKAFTLEELVQTNTVAPQLVKTLEALVDRKASTIISGATGTGKTTVLATLLGLVPHDERIVCIEEVAELHPDHPHVVHLQERRPNVQDVGSVTMVELVRSAMRMRPDRIVLGECRGAEVREVLSALNTGHEGGWATIHANASTDVPARLVALGALAGMSETTVAVQACAAFDAVVHVRRLNRAMPQKENLGNEYYNLKNDDQPGLEQKQTAHRWVAEIGVPARKGAELFCEIAIQISAEGRISRGVGWKQLEAYLGAAAMPNETVQDVNSSLPSIESRLQ